MQVYENRNDGISGPRKVSATFQGICHRPLAPLVTENNCKDILNSHGDIKLFLIEKSLK